MSTYNLSLFERFVFRVPSLRALATGIVVLGSVYSVVLYALFRFFLPVPVEPVLIGWLAVFVFIGPTAVTGEAFHALLSDYPRRWGYLIALVNQLLIFLYAADFALISSPDMAWKLLWLGVVTVYSLDYAILVLTAGSDSLRKISVLSVAHPLLIVPSFHVFFGAYLRQPVSVYLSNLGILVIVSLLLAGIVFLHEYLLRTNTPHVSGIRLTADLLHHRGSSLDIGYPARPEVHTLSIRNESDTATLVAPWVHPGPIGGFGGAAIPGEIIEAVNTDGTGFFLHVPSTHQSDPTDADAADKIMEAVTAPDRTGYASKLIRAEYDDITFYGRRFGEKNVVYIVSKYGDYDEPVFREVIDTDETLLVDTHSFLASESEEPVYYGSIKADRMQDRLREFLDDLRDAELAEYRAGFAADPDDTPAFALVEEVDGQRTLLLGRDENGASQGMLDLQEEYRDRFDDVVVFTTDTHSSVRKLALGNPVDRGRVRALVEEAVADVSPAQIGMGVKRSPALHFLQSEYFGLMYSINIITRLFPVTLVFLYVLLLIWLL